MVGNLRQSWGVLGRMIESPEAIHTKLNMELYELQSIFPINLMDAGSF